MRLLRLAAAAAPPGLKRCTEARYLNRSVEMSSQEPTLDTAVDVVWTCLDEELAVVRVCDKCRSRKNAATSVGGGYLRIQSIPWRLQAEWSVRPGTAKGKRVDVRLVIA
jgi:hypothetical protein